jgi:TusE/DsrC/DsvC family sulfur relay protein
VTLGQLLHSTSLAPGESTRVAVIDWTRASRAGETEQITEVDDLTNDQSHNRSISEVTKAVATEKGMDKKQASEFLYAMFPKGPALQACKIAGLPKPTGCV